MNNPRAAYLYIPESPSIIEQESTAKSIMVITTTAIVSFTVLGMFVCI